MTRLATVMRELAASQVSVGYVALMQALSRVHRFCCCLHILAGPQAEPSLHVSVLAVLHVFEVVPDWHTLGVSAVQLDVLFMLQQVFVVGEHRFLWHSSTRPLISCGMSARL